MANSVPLVATVYCTSPSSTGGDRAGGGEHRGVWRRASPRIGPQSPSKRHRSRRIRSGPLAETRDACGGAGPPLREGLGPVTARPLPDGTGDRRPDQQRQQYQHPDPPSK